jgi:hypothetical protein
VDGFRLWYRVPDSYPVARSADPFLAAALLPAMARGEELEVDSALTVSPELLENAFHLQEVFHTWNPALKKIPITARTARAEELSGGGLSFFSGGVDSTHTFLKHLDDISHVVFIHGFSFYSADESYKAAVEGNTSLVAAFGKTLIPVETNFYPFGYRYALSILLTQGSCLASVALLLGFSVAYIPAAVAYDQLVPIGSHPLTDPLWSNECVQIVHDGREARRVDKLRAIAPYAEALANLRVCENDINVNCGRCGKCLRTMVALRFLGAEGPFPPLPPLASVVKAALRDDNELIFTKENLALASLDGDPQTAALRNALTRGLRRAELRRAVRDLDSALLGGRVRRLFVKSDTDNCIETTPPRD